MLTVAKFINININTVGCLRIQNAFTDSHHKFLGPKLADFTTRILDPKFILTKMQVVKKNDIFK